MCVYKQPYISSLIVNVNDHIQADPNDEYFDIGCFFYGCKYNPVTNENIIPSNNDFTFL